MIIANSDKPWNWSNISLNKFTKEKEEFEWRVNKQKFVREHLWEEIVKYVYHPSRILKYLEQGYDIFELDGIM